MFKTNQAFNIKQVIKVLLIACMSIYMLNANSNSLKPSVSIQNYHGIRQTWENNITLLGFFDRNGIPQSLYYNLPIEDKELITDIYAGSTYYTLLDSNDKIMQAFIPISESAQIRIFFEEGTYKLNIIPISSIVVRQTIVLDIKGLPYDDLRNASKDSALAAEFTSAYKGVIDFKKHVFKGDILGIIFDRRYRLGKPIGAPHINVALIQSMKNTKTSKQKNLEYVFGFNDGYYDYERKEVTNFFLITPLSYRRISSKFSYGRLHPILKIRRPHFGVDFAANVGTPISAAATGRVIFAGNKGGYGKMIEISHKDGIKTLYAHLSSISRGIRAGKQVRQGQRIGAVGSTGISTGPHLHFGVYKYNQPINPLGRIKSARNKLTKKQAQEFDLYANKYKDLLSADITEYIANLDKDKTEVLLKKKLINRL